MARIDDFGAAIAKHVSRYPVYPNVNAELSAIAAALNADTTLHDATIVTPPQELTIGGDKTPFTNNILHVINKGRGANLRSSQMGSAINGLLGMSPTTPAITKPPVASGGQDSSNTVHCTSGSWNYNPTSYAYQWLRGPYDGAPDPGGVILGATSASYALTPADDDHSLSCQVTAINVAGSAMSISNFVNAFLFG
jgi:hypothetical protein